MIIERRSVGAEENGQQKSRSRSGVALTLAEVRSGSRTRPDFARRMAEFRLSTLSEELCGVVLDDDDGRSVGSEQLDCSRTED